MNMEIKVCCDISFIKLNFSAIVVAFFTNVLSLLLANILVFLYNPFHATDLFLYPLKTSENLWFFDVSMGIERNY